MTVYVDDVQLAAPFVKDKKKWPYKQFCHLWADSLPELEEFAAQLGLNPKWLQSHHADFPHYDLVPSKRAKAIQLGAQKMSLHDWLVEKRPLAPEPRP